MMRIAASRSHYEAEIAELAANRELAAEYLKAALQSLDAQVVFTQLPELAAFARAIPDLTIVLNHLGGLWRIGPFAGRDDEVLPAWKQGLAEVAACPNVFMKLGGIGMPRFGFDWYTRDTPIRPTINPRPISAVVRSHDRPNSTYTRKNRKPYRQT